MTDLVVVPGSAVWNSGVSPIYGFKAGVAITGLQAVYLDATTATIKLARATTVVLNQALGIALTPGNTGSGELVIAPNGANINIGVTTVAGTAYVVSANAGGIAPWADLGTGNFPTFLFWGTGSANVTLQIAIGAVAHA